MSRDWRRAGFTGQSAQRWLSPDGWHGILALHWCDLSDVQGDQKSAPTHLCQFGGFLNLASVCSTSRAAVIQTSAKGISLMMEKPCSWPVTVHEWRHHLCVSWRNGGPSMHPCDRPSRAHNLPVCSLCFSDSTGCLCVLRNLVTAIHSYLKPASLLFWDDLRDRLAKPLKLWLSHAVPVTCYWITQQTSPRLLHMDLFVLV